LSQWRESNPRKVFTYRLLFVDIGELAIYCPACAEREFGDSDRE
jgi:hypothetical protein